MSKKDAAIHKRQQIEQSSRVMFLWVAGASVIVGFALVISWFLVQQIIFKERVLGEKNNTAAVLKNNNDAVEKLRGELKVLETNSHLNASRINNDEKALQVVLDALPAEDNAIDQTDDSESSNSTGAAASNGNLQSIHFTMEVSASNPNALRELLQRFERSIRVIEIDRMTIERTDSKVAMKISAHAYYSPAKTIELKKKDIKP